MAKLLSYKVKWNLDSHKGQIDLKLWGGNPANYTATFTVALHPQTPAEMHMLLDLLRNEKPLEYDNGSQELRCGEWETVGEGET